MTLRPNDQNRRDSGFKLESTLSFNLSARSLSLSIVLEVCLIVSVCIFELCVPKIVKTLSA